MTVPTQPDVPSPPAGYTWQLIWSDDFSGTASDPVAGITGLNRLYWNDGTFNGPNTPGQGTSNTGPPGNTTESMSPSMISVNPGGDSCLHIKCVNNTVGGLQSLGLVGWNPAGHALPSNLATAKTNGQYVDLTGTICTELRVKQWGPTGADNGNWWCWFGHYNMGDGYNSVVSAAYGGEHYSQEIDLCEQNGGNCTGAAWNVHWHAANSESYNSCYSSSLQSTDVSLAFHNLDYIVDPTGIYYTGTSWGFGQYCDGANSDIGANPYANGSQVSAQYAEPMAMWIAGQLRGSANNTQTDYMVDYIAVWQLVSGTTPTKPSISTTSLPSGTVGTTYSANVTATSGTSPYSWTVTAGTLPTGLSINASKSLTVTVSGTPSVAGSSTFTLQITDANGYTASQQFTIVVAAAPTKISITTTSLPVGTVGTAYSAQLAATGGAPSSGSGGGTQILTPAVVQSSPNDVAGTSLPLNFGAATTAGNLLLAFIITFGGTLTAPSGWTLVKSQALSGAGATASVYAYPNAPSTTDTTWTGTVAYMGGVISEVENATATLDVSAYDSGTITSNSATSPALPNATTADAAFMIIVASGAVVGSPTASGWTDVANTSNGNVSMAVMEQNLVVGQGAPAEAVSWNGGANTAFNYGIFEVTLQAATTSGSSGGTSIVQSAGLDTSTTTLGLSLPSATSTANTVLAFIQCYGTLTAPTGWTLIKQYDTFTYGGGNINCYAYTAGTSIPANTAQDFTCSAAYMGGVICEISGIGTTMDVFAETSGNPSANNITSAALGPTTTADLAFMFMNASTNAEPSAINATGWSLLQGYGANNDVAGFLAYQNLASGATAPSENISWTSAGAATNVELFEIAIKQTASAPANGPPIYTWSVTSGALEAGLSLDSSTGAISGTPSASGSPVITFEVQDQASNNATANLTLTVNPATTPGALTITTASLPNATVGAQYSATVAASGGTSPYTWSFSSGAPSWLSINASTGAISGTPSVAGVPSVTVDVQDSSGSSPATASRQYTITISAAPSSGSVSITTTQLPAAVVGRFYSQQLTASGGTTPYIWSETGTLPAGLSLSTAGVISGTPTDSGSASITWNVRDSSATPLTASQVIPFVVNTAVTTQVVTVSETQLTSALTVQPGGDIGAPVGSTPYNSLKISWTLPLQPGDYWNEQILLRSSFGTPESIYETDGVVLLDQLDPQGQATPSGGWTTTYYDAGLKPGHFYYYALFVFQTNLPTTQGQPSQSNQWVQAGAAQGLVLTDWDFRDTFASWLPDFYSTMDGLQPQPGPLAQFLALIGYEVDWIRSEIESLFLVNNAELISGALLPALGGNFGVQLEPSLGMTRSRVLVKNAVALYQQRGTLRGVQAAASAYSGFGAVATCIPNPPVTGIYPNLIHQLDGGAFDSGLGNWRASPGNSASTMSPCAGSVAGVIPQHNSYHPVPNVPGFDPSAPAASNGLVYGNYVGYLPNPRNNENVGLMAAANSVLSLTTCTSEDAPYFGVPIPQPDSSAFDSTALALGLVSYLELQDAPGSGTAADSAGTYTGLAAGGVSFGQPGPFPGVNAVIFDGASGYIEAPIPTPSGAVSIFGWVNMEDPQVDSQLFGWRGATANEFYMLLRNQTAPGELECRFTNSAGTSYTLNPTISLGAWHFLVMTYDGSTNLNVYVDGALAASMTASGTLGLYEVFGIGANVGVTPVTMYYPGAISRVGVTNFALTNTQQQNLYNAAWPTANEYVFSAWLQPYQGSTVRSFKLQLDWYAQNGGLLSSTQGTAVTEVAGQWVQGYVAAAPPHGACYLGRTIFSTTTLLSDQHLIDAVKVELSNVTSGATPTNWVPPRDIRVSLLPVRQNLVSDPQGFGGGAGWTAQNGTIVPWNQIGSTPAINWPARTRNGYILTAGSGITSGTGQGGAAAFGADIPGGGWFGGAIIGGQAQQATPQQGSVGNLVLATTVPVWGSSTTDLNEVYHYTFSVYMLAATTPRLVQLMVTFYNSLNNPVSLPPFTGTLGQTLQAGAQYNSLPVAALPYAVQLGQTFTLNPGGTTSQLLQASAAVNAGATSIPVVPFVANQGYVSGTHIAFGYTQFLDALTSNGEFPRGAIVNMISPPNAVSATIQITVAGPSQDEQHYMTGVLFAPESSLQSYFDAHFLPASDYLWEGTPNDSVSDYYPNLPAKLTRLIDVLPEYIPLGATFSLVTGAGAALTGPLHG